MTDRIELRGMRFAGRHGALPREALEAQPFEVDVVLELDLAPAGTTDDLAVWRRLADRFRVDVFCGFFMRDANEGISVSPLTLKRLGERGIELGLDIYAPSQKLDD